MKSYRVIIELLGVHYASAGISGKREFRKHFNKLRALKAPGVIRTIEEYSPTRGWVETKDFA